MHYVWTCPKCESHCFGSTLQSDDTLQRLCHGYVSRAADDGTDPCGFTWNEREDVRYLKPDPFWERKELEIQGRVTGVMAIR